MCFSSLGARIKDARDYFPTETMQLNTPPPEVKILQLNPPEAVKMPLHLVLTKFTAPSAPEKPIYTLIFTFYCTFTKYFFRKITLRITFRNPLPKKLYGKNFLPLYTQILAFYCI